MPTKEEAKSTPRSQFSTTNGGTITNNIAGTTVTPHVFFGENEKRAQTQGSLGTQQTNKEIGSSPKVHLQTGTMETPGDAKVARRLQKLPSETLVPMPEIRETSPGGSGQEVETVKELPIVVRGIMKRKSEQIIAAPGVNGTANILQVAVKDSAKKNLFPMSLSALAQEDKNQSLISRAGTNSAVDLFPEKEKSKDEGSKEDLEGTNYPRDRANSARGTSRRWSKVKMIIPEKGAGRQRDGDQIPKSPRGGNEAESMKTSQPFLQPGGPPQQQRQKAVADGVDTPSRQAAVKENPAVIGGSSPLTAKTQSMVRQTL
jgi:hypothetical protein